MPFRIFRGPLFPKPVTDQERFFYISYSKLALVCIYLVFFFLKFVLFYSIDLVTYLLGVELVSKYDLTIALAPHCATS